MVPDHGKGVQAAGKLEDARAVRTAVDQVAAEGEAMVVRIEAGGGEKIVQLRRAALYVAHEQHVRHGPSERLQPCSTVAYASCRLGPSARIPWPPGDSRWGDGCQTGRESAT